MLMLKLQSTGHLTRRADSLEKTLMLGKVEGKRRVRRQRMKWLDSITDSKDVNQTKLWETAKDRGSLACCSPRACMESRQGLAIEQPPPSLSQVQTVRS